MLRQLFIAAAVITTLIGCGSKAAFNYSEDIVKIERSLSSDIQSTQLDAKSFLDAGNYDSLAANGEKMEKKVQEKIDQVDALPLPDAKGAADFKTAALGYFRHLKSIFTGYKNIGTAQSQEQRDEATKGWQETVAKTTAVLRDMQSAQKKYAEANGFKLQ